MKVAVIWSSPNRDGLTAGAKNHVIAGLRKAHAEVDEIHLNRLKIEHCRACGDGWGACRSQGACVLQDDFGPVYERLAAADGIVWISAVYWSDLTECLKSFIDRLRRCEAMHNHLMKQKRCLLVACAGGTGNGTLDCLHQMEKALGHMGMRAYDRLPLIRYNKDYMLPALEKAGEVYAQRLESGFDMYY